MCLVEGCAKIILFVFNFVFVIAGIGLIVVGTLYKLDFNEITDAIPDDYVHLELAPILTIVLGCIIFLISFFGCCGAIKESSCLLTTYAVILLTIFLLQVGLGVFAFIEVNDEKDLEKEVNRTIEDIFSKYSENKTTELVDFIQQELKCCGVKGPSYWESHIPVSCCEDKNCKSHTPYKTGCQIKFIEFLKDTAKVIGLVLLCLSATEVIGAIISLCLANSIRNSKRRDPYS